MCGPQAAARSRRAVFLACSTIGDSHRSLPQVSGAA
jgi:hypothetical protein